MRKLWHNAAYRGFYGAKIRKYIQSSKYLTILLRFVFKMCLRSGATRYALSSIRPTGAAADVSADLSRL